MASGLSGILGRLIWPLAMDGVQILSSPYGTRLHPRSGGERFHRGLDLRADQGTPVYAVADGRVERSGWSGAYGNLILLSHAFRLSTRYGHLSRFAVRPGQQVARGDVIGYVGSTGRSTGSHLHYEVLANGRPINPLQLLTQPSAAR